MSSEEEGLLARRSSFSDFDLVGDQDDDTRCGCVPPKDEDGCVLCCSTVKIPSWGLILFALLGGAAFVFYPSDAGSRVPAPTEPRRPGAHQPGPAELLELEIAGQEPRPAHLEGSDVAGARLRGTRDETGRRYRNFILSYQEFDTQACPSGAVLETKVGGQIETKCIELNTPVNLGPGIDPTPLHFYANNFDAQWCIAVGGQSKHIRLEVDVKKFDLEPGFDRFYITHNDQLANAFFGSDTSKIPPRMRNLVVHPGKKGHLCTALSTDDSVQGSLEFTLTAKEFSGELEHTECFISVERQPHEKFPCGIGVQYTNHTCPEADSGCEAFEYKSWCFSDTLCGRDRVPQVCTKEIAADSKTCNNHGWGMKDASDPDLWKVIYAKNQKFNVDTILTKLKKARQDLLDYWATHVEHPEWLLSHGIAENAEEENDSRMVGGRLIRSLLFGDRFTIGFTGSSNTAGHQNTFEATYPIQLQSMLRPVWAEIGYKGAAFQSRNHAHGGHISTMDQAWMQAAMVGEDVDVVFWESVMNDGGMFRQDKGGELALRQALGLAKRPFYMGLDATHKATDITDVPREFKSMQKHYKNVGMMFFRPTHGTKEIIQKYGETENEKKFLYISWHPGPQGHRLYGSCIAWEYLTSAIKVLEGNMQKFKSAAPDGVPTKALEDVFFELKIYRPAELVRPTDQMNGVNFLKINVVAWTLTLNEPVMPEAYLDNYVVDQGGFKRTKDQNPDVGDVGDNAMCRMKGGKYSCDAKARYSGAPGADPFKLKVLVQERLLWFQHAYFSNRLVKGGKDGSSLLPQANEWHIVIDGKDYECIGGDQVPRINSKNLLSDIDWAGQGGCIIEPGPGKFVIEIHTDRLAEGHQIYFDTVVTL